MTPANRTDCATLLDLLRFRASENSGSADAPAFTFLEDGERVSASLTFRQLERKALRLAARLQSVAQPGDRVLLVFPPGLDYIVAFFACAAAGLVAVPALPPANSKTLPRLRLIIQDAQPSVALAPAAIVERFGAAPELAAGNAMVWLAADGGPDAASDTASDAALDATLDAARDATLDASPDAAPWRAPKLAPDDLLFLQYTSGSTGNPKGVMVSHRNLLANVALSEAAYGITARDTFVSWLPPHHDFGLIGAILFPVFCGCHSVQFPPAAFLMRPVRWLRLVSQYRARMTGAPNFAYQLCVQRVTEQQKAELDLSCLEIAVNGAERIRMDTLRQFAAAFAACGLRPEALTPAYGMAESVLLACANMDREPGRLPQSRAVSKAGLERGLVQDPANAADSVEAVATGRQFCDEHRLAVVDPATSARQPEQRVGEVWVHGTSVARGYWGRPEASMESFGARLEGTAGWLRTGDLGFFGGGQLHITGRTKEVMIFNGRNIYPQDVELTVEALDPAFRPNGCAVFALDEGSGPRLVAVQEVESRQQADCGPLVSRLRAELSERHDIMNLAALLLVRPGGIPRTSSGKLQRLRCKQLFQDGGIETVWEWRAAPAGGEEAAGGRSDTPAFVPPQGPLECGLAEIWQEVLGLEAVGRHDRFTDLGGHSLALTKLGFMVKERFGVTLNLAQLYELQDLEQLARHIAQAQDKARVTTTMVMLDLDDDDDVDDDGSCDGDGGGTGDRPGEGAGHGKGGGA